MICGIRASRGESSRRLMPTPRESRRLQPVLRQAKPPRARSVQKLRLLGVVSVLSRIRHTGACFIPSCLTPISGFGLTKREEI